MYKNTKGDRQQQEASQENLKVPRATIKTVMHLWQEVPIIAILLVSCFIHFKQVTGYKIKKTNTIKSRKNKEKRNLLSYNNSRKWISTGFKKLIVDILLGAVSHWICIPAWLVLRWLIHLQAKRLC